MPTVYPTSSLTYQSIFMWHFYVFLFISIQFILTFNNVSYCLRLTFLHCFLPQALTRDGFLLYELILTNSDVFTVTDTWKRCCPPYYNQMGVLGRKDAADGPHAQRWSLYPGIVPEGRMLKSGSKERKEGGLVGGGDTMIRWMNIWGASRDQSKLPAEAPGSGLNIKIPGAISIQ